MGRALLSQGKDAILRVFDIRVGEVRRVWLMQLNIFLLIHTLWIIKPIVNAQFLSRVGIDRLPLVFLLVAITAFAFSTAYSGLLARMSLGRIMARTYLVSILAILAFAVTLHAEAFRDWMSYVLYIGVALFGLITTSQFWILGNLVFTSLEAKRLFGFLGAGAIAGGISGGYLTSWLAPVMDSENLLFVAAGLLIIALFVNQTIWSRFVPPFDRTIQIRQAKSMHELPVKLIRNSRHLSYLALIMGISVVVAKLVEFQFSAIASARITDPDRLTAFFGFWFSTSNAVSLLIQVLVTQRIVAFLGVSRSLYVLPGALFAGAAAVLHTPVLWTGTMLKVADISLKQSINKAATELLIMPIPMAIKSQAKTFIDVFVDTTATGIGGILLILLVNGFDLSVRAVAIMILGLIGVWIYFVIRVRKEYALAFQEKLGIPRRYRRARAIVLSDASVIKGIRRTLRSGTTNQILFLLARIEESKSQQLMPDVVPLLAHASPAVREAALRALYYAHDHTITAQVKPLLRDPHDEVRFRAFATMLAHTREARVTFIEQYLNDPDPAIRAAAIVGLATEARDNEEMQRLFRLEERLQEKISEASRYADPAQAETTAIIVSRAIGYGRLKALYPVLSGYLNADNPEVVRQAMLAAGSTEDPDFIPTLLEFLPDASTREAAQRAFAKYEPDQLFSVLAEQVREKNFPLDIFLQLPALAESIDTPKAIDFLLDLAVHPDARVKRRALESLHDLIEQYPHLTIPNRAVMALLREEADAYGDTITLGQSVRHSAMFRENPKASDAGDAILHQLDTRLDMILERIFWIIGLRHPSRAVLALLKDLHHPDPATRIAAIELLDNMLHPAMKRIVNPVVETAVMDRTSDDILTRLDKKPLDAITCLEHMLKGDDDHLKLATLALIDALDKPEFDYLVQMASGDVHAHVRHAAERIMREG